MNIIIADILSKIDMKEARSNVYKPSKQLHDHPERSIKTVFKNSYVDINYTLEELDIADKISSHMSKRDVNIILEYAKIELKRYKRIGNYYIKWEWTWNSDHTIVVLFLIDLILNFTRR